MLDLMSMDKVLEIKPDRVRLRFEAADLNTGQQVGGSIGTALLSTLAASAAQQG